MPAWGCGHPVGDSRAKGSGACCKGRLRGVQRGHGGRRGPGEGRRLWSGGAVWGAAAWDRGFQAQGSACGGRGPGRPAQGTCGRGQGGWWHPAGLILEVLECPAQKLFLVPRATGFLHRVTLRAGSGSSLLPSIGLPGRKGGGSYVQAGSKRRQGCDNDDSSGLGLGWLCRCRLCIG